MNTQEKGGGCSPVIVALLCILGGLAVMAVLIVAGFLWALQTGGLASTEVLPGNKVPGQQRNDIAKIVHLENGEQIQWFYSSSMTVFGDGNLLTDRRVVSYQDDGDGPWIEEIAYEDIASAELFRAGESSHSEERVPKQNPPLANARPSLKGG